MTGKNIFLSPIVAHKTVWCRTFYGKFRICNNSEDDKITVTVINNRFEFKHFYCKITICPVAVWLEKTFQKFFIKVKSLNHFL